MSFKITISLKLLLFILPLVCIPIAVTGYFSIQAAEERVNRLVRHEQTVKADTIARRIDDIFYYCRMDLKTIAGLPILEDYHLARSFRLEAEAAFNQEKIINLFREFISRTAFYYQIRYVDEKGRELIRVRADGAMQGDPQTSWKKLLQSGSAAASVRNLEGTLVSDITKPASGRGYLMHWGRPVFSGWHEPAGMVVIDLDYEKIITTIKAIHVGQKGYAFLADSQGRVAAHPAHEPYSLDRNNMEDASGRKLLAAMREGQRGWQAYIFEGNRKVAAYAPIPVMGWAAAVTIPSLEYTSEARAIRTRVVQVALLTLLLAVGGVSILSYFLLKPIRNLALATHRVADGDLGQVIPVRSRDELGDLTRSFNHMMKNLARTQNELIRSEKLISLGRLSAGVAHEIRNPLNAIKGAVIFLQRKRADDALLMEYTQLVYEEIERLNTFVTEFLFFARQAKPKPAPTDLNRLILATQSLFQETLRQRQVRFNNHLEPDLGPIMIDPHQIEQVIVNIIVNALDAVADQGKITFSTFRSSSGSTETEITDWIRIEVRDNGSGIDEAHLKNVFDPFFSTKESGTGLGLPLSLGIIENHGGIMTIEPREGHGTKVIISLPEEGCCEEKNPDR
jgi:signal transduction histidine kinase